MTVDSYDPMGRVQDYWQCTPYNCPSSSFWHSQYTYDLAGDVASWTHPAGFTITNTINAAQQITQIESSLVDSTHPQYLAQNIAYTPWGAESTLEDGCAGSGCVNTMETYAYNNRLQPVEIELGTTANPAADYCLVYNDYASLGSPGSCAVPGQGTGDNGNVRGYLYQDSVNSSLSHAATYSYDSLNRLTNAAATGSSTYNFTFNYDRWGNMTCTINAQTNGPCPEYSFNSANNQVTNTGYTYDAAGNLTTDLTTLPSSAYQWDAEGHLTTITQGGGAYSTSAYNANGQMVETVYPAFGNAKTEALLDPFGRELGYYDGKMNAWFDRDFWVAGQMFAQSYPSETYFLHHNVPGSDVQLTNHSGTPTVDILYYPWGGENTHIGYESDSHFAGFEQTGGNLNPTPTRRYANPMGRWLTPDLMGGDIANPQSLNRYAYALNNPTTLTDPLGLDSMPYQPPTVVNVYGSSPTDFQILPCTYEAIAEAACYGGSSPAPPGWYEGSTSGGIGVAPAPAPKPAPPPLFAPNGATARTPNHCAGQALKKNAVALSLDVGGVGAGFLPGGDLVVAGVQVGIGAASAINSVANRDVPGFMAGAFGFQIAAVVPASKLVGVGAKSIPFVGAVLSVASTVRDAGVTYGDYRSCVAGH